MMTPEQKNIECAKLDGWRIDIQNNEGINWIKPDGDIITIWTTGNNDETLKPYSTSYDAIIPLIQKWVNEGNDDARDRAYHLGEVLCNLMYGYATSSIDYAEAYDVWMKATPSQLQDALLKAHGFEL